MHRIKHFVSSVLTHPSSGALPTQPGAQKKPPGASGSGPSTPTPLPPAQARSGLSRLLPSPDAAARPVPDGKALAVRGLRREPGGGKGISAQSAKAPAESTPASPPSRIALSNQRLREAVEKAIEGTDPAGKDRLRSSLTNAVFARIFKDHGDAYESGTLSTETLEQLIEGARKQ